MIARVGRREFAPTMVPVATEVDRVYDSRHLAEVLPENANAVAVRISFRPGFFRGHDSCLFHDLGRDRPLFRLLGYPSLGPEPPLINAARSAATIHLNRISDLS